MARRNNQVEQEILEDDFLEDEQTPTEEWMNEEEFDNFRRETQSRSGNISQAQKVAKRYWWFGVPALQAGITW